MAAPIAGDDPSGFTTVFNETFAAATLTGWTAVRINASAPRWRIVNGAVVEDSDAGWGFLRPTTIAATTSSATSYRLSVDIDPSVAAGVPPSNDKVGLVFGWTNAGNYYRVEWTDFGSNWQSRSTYRDLQIVRVQNGTESILAKLDAVDLPISGFKLGVTVDAGGISLLVDGVARLQAAGARPSLGVFGLYSWDNDQGVSFDNVKVELGSGTGAYAATAGQALGLSAAQLLANDSDADGDPLAITAVSGAVNGTVSLAGTTITFTPTAGFQGNASFVYTVSDGRGGSDTATVFVTVNPAANRNPDAINDTATTTAATPVTIAVLGNDVDPDGDALSVTGVGAAANGTLVRNANNTVTYTPYAGFSGTDSFTYSVSDGRGGSDTATVAVTVNPAANRNPDAINDPAGLTTVLSEAFSGAALTGWTSVRFNAAPPNWRIAGGVLVEDSDAGFGFLRPTTIVPSTSSATTYVLSADIDPSIAAGTPPSNDVVGLVFGHVNDDNYYRVEWADFGSNWINLADYRDLQIVRVQNGVDTILAKLDAVNLPLAGFKLGVSVDAGGITLLVDGVARLQAAGARPSLGVFGLYSWDNDQGVSFDNVKLELGGGSGAFPANSGQPDTLTAAQLLANDTDPDGDPLAITGVSGAVNGTVALSGSNVTFTPTAGFQGAASFNYTISDGRGGADTATVAFTVSPPPVLALEASNFTVNEGDGTVTIRVLRSGPTGSAVSVQYTTVDQSALSGSDYTARSGVLQLAAGQTSASIVVPISNDTAIEGDELFNIAIDGPQGGASLGSPRTATVLIVDNDAVDLRPVLTGLAANVALSEAVAKLSAQIIDPAVTLTDADSANFSGGQLRVTGGLAEDLVGLRNAGTGAGQIGFDGSTVTFGGITIGTRAAGPASGLIVDLNANATPAATEALVEALTYQNAATGAPTLNRTLSLTVADGAGHTSDADTVQITVTPTVETGTFSAQTVASGFFNPTAIDFDNAGHMYIAQQDGIVRVLNNSVLQATPFVDIRAEVNFVSDRGLLGVAVHPDFQNHPYVYVAYTYDPPETANFTGNAGADGIGNRVARVSRFTATTDAQGNVTAVPGSEVVLLGKNSNWAAISRPDLDSTEIANASIPPSSTPVGGANGTLYSSIPNDSSSHTVGNLEFGSDGALYISVGDGTSYGHVDARALRVQDLNSLSGKLLRVDPITGEGLPGNPWFSPSGPNGADDNIDKVIDYGLRNPFRFALDPTTGTPYIGDVGWNTYEEVNSGFGKNFGWPYFEGVAGSNQQTGGYNTLPGAAAFYASNNASSPLWGQFHASPDNARAIVVGDFYTGPLYPSSYRNALFISDFGTQQLRVMRLNPDGSVQSVAPLNVNTGVTVEMSMGPDGYLYYVDITGKIGRLVFTPTGGTPPAAQPGSVTGPPPPGSGSGPAFLEGTSHADTLIGSAKSDAITGYAGTDLVKAQGGDDLIFAVVGDGRDNYFGDGGRDTYDLSRTSAPARVDLGGARSASADTGNDRLFSIENVVGSAGGDSITGSSADNVLTGGLGSDQLIFRPGFGKDIVTDFGDSAGDQDLIVFARAVFASFAEVQAAIHQLGQDVEIVVGSTDVLTLRNVDASNLGAEDFWFG